jgi:hypothetical protein
MAYTPKNIQIFTAAFAGALAGMGLSDRIISDSNALTYAGLATVAGAFAQAIDTAWTVARSATLLDVEAIQSESAAYWQDRSPNNDATTSNPATYAAAALAILATITASETYFAAQGIIPPAIPGGSSGGGFPNVADLATLGAIDWTTAALANGYQYYVHTKRCFYVLSQTGTETIEGNRVIAATGGGRWLRNQSFAHPSWLYVGNWWIDPTNGNDENDGQAATPAPNRVGPLKTHAELEMRWNKGTLMPPAYTLLATMNVCTVNILGSLPSTDPVNIEVAFGANAAGQSYSAIIYQGRAASVLASGTFSAVTARNTTTNQQWQATDPTTIWTTYLNRRVRITSVGANANTTFFVAKDLGANQARMSEPGLCNSMISAPSAFNKVFGGFVQKTPIIGDTYNIETLTSVQIGTLGARFIPKSTGGGVAVNFFELEIQNLSTSSSFTLQSGQGVGPNYLFESCVINPPVLAQPSSMNFNNCLFVTGLIIDGANVQVNGGMIVSTTGLVFRGIGYSCSVRFTLCQAASVRGGNCSFQDVGIFDVATNASFNPGGHGVVVGQNLGSNSVPSAMGLGTLGIGTISLYGSGNVGAGVFVGSGCTMSYKAGATLAVTGTGGDFSFNGKGSGSPWDQTAAAGVGAYTAQVTNTWAHLAATIGAGGFGGNAHDVANNCHILQAA